MMTKDEALKMAIEAMSITMVDTKGVNDDGYWTLNIPYNFALKAIQACREALEQPEPRMFLDLSNSNGNHPVEQPAQEPVAWECFLDPAYYDMWAIRQTGNRNFEETIHVVNGKEAKQLCSWLNSLNTHPAPQPAQEPVAWISESTLKHSVEYRNRFNDAKSWAEIRAVDRKTTNCDVPLYTHPAP
jgi:hypothetical protein